MTSLITRERRVRRLARAFAAGFDACHYCGRLFGMKLHPTKDHVIPRSKGGSLAPENVVYACRICNEARGDMPYDEFVKTCPRIRRDPEGTETP